VSEIKFRRFSEKELVAGLIFGEARLSEMGSPDEIKEYLSIAWTVKNRADNKNRWPSTITDVILQPKQFSCFNPEDPNSLTIEQFLMGKLDPPTLHKYMVYVVAFIQGRTPDFSCGANHYVAIWFYNKAVSSHWCRKMRITAVYGGHIFLTDKS